MLRTNGTKGMIKTKHLSFSFFKRNYIEQDDETNQIFVSESSEHPVLGVVLVPPIHGRARGQGSKPAKVSFGNPGN